SPHRWPWLRHESRRRFPGAQVPAQQLRQLAIVRPIVMLQPFPYLSRHGRIASRRTFVDFLDQAVWKGVLEENLGPPDQRYAARQRCRIASALDVNHLVRRHGDERKDRPQQKIRVAEEILEPQKEHLLAGKKPQVIFDLLSVASFVEIDAI